MSVSGFCYWISMEQEPAKRHCRIFYNKQFGGRIRQKHLSGSCPKEIATFRVLFTHDKSLVGFCIFVFNNFPTKLVLFNENNTQKRCFSRCIARRVIGIHQPVCFDAEIQITLVTGMLKKHGHVPEKIVF